MSEVDPLRQMLEPRLWPAYDRLCRAIVTAAYHKWLRQQEREQQQKSA